MENEPKFQEKRISGFELYKNWKLSDGIPDNLICYLYNCFKLWDKTILKIPREDVNQQIIIRLLTKKDTESIFQSNTRELNRLKVQFGFTKYNGKDRVDPGIMGERVFDGWKELYINAFEKYYRNHTATQTLRNFGLVGNSKIKNYMSESFPKQINRRGPRQFNEFIPNK
ncbi:MAG: hypothetical protein ACOYN4_18545 [Bacteroidales bacterium]